VAPRDGDAPPVLPEPVVAELPVADWERPPTLDPGGGPDCGHQLLFMTGRGTTLRFRAIALPDAPPEEVVYDSGGVELSLRGLAAESGTTWTMTLPDGTVRRFDERGLLTRIESPNGVGLDFVWEPGVIRLDWRLALVTDAVGRAVEYAYDDEDYLISVTDTSSGLAAVYTYDEHGDLRSATDASGKTESYTYDIDPTREAGDWIPEGYAEAACEAACAPSSSSCDAGGACDQPYREAIAACLASCGECATACRGACGGACASACREGTDESRGCVSQCLCRCDY